MGEYEFRDNLVTLAVFHSATEASMLQARLEAEGITALVDGDVTTTMLSHIGAGLINTRVVVRQGDITQARAVLESVRLQEEDEEPLDNDEQYHLEEEDYDGDDWSGEDWADADGGYADGEYDDWADDDEPYSEAPPITPPVKRAFRAAVIGAFLLPPLLTLYSLAIIIQHRLWEPAEGEEEVDWRVYVSFVFHAIGLLFAWWLFGSPSRWFEN